MYSLEVCDNLPACTHITREYSIVVVDGLHPVAHHRQDLYMIGLVRKSHVSRTQCSHHVVNTPKMFIFFRNLLEIEAVVLLALAGSGCPVEVGGAPTEVVRQACNGIKL